MTTRHHPLIAASLLGFALGGFFDGVLLHQILQWHHLLSGIEAISSQLELQILADGLFHAAMYGVLLIGLVLLYRSRRVRLGASQMFGAAALGFGVWHGLDALLSHWLLGLHRIRMDTDLPLAWDLGWLLVFGVLPAALGVFSLRRRPDGRGPLPAMLLLAFATPLIGAAGLWPAPADAAQAVLFRAGLDEGGKIAAVEAAGGAVLSVSADGRLWQVRFDDRLRPLQLYLRGALLVGGAPGGGCLGATLVKG